MTPTMRDVNKKFSVRYYLNLVLIDEEERRYFKQQVGCCRNLQVRPSVIIQAECDNTGWDVQRFPECLQGKDEEEKH